MQKAQENLGLFRLLTNPRFSRGFVPFEAISDDRKRWVAAGAGGAH